MPLPPSSTAPVILPVSVSKGGTGATSQSAAATAILPSQTGQSGNYLTTNGTNVSWASVSGSANAIPVFNVQNSAYGATGNANNVVDGAISATFATLTSATANFTSGDVGKNVFVTGAGAAGAQLSTTISGFTNSTTVTLAATASTTVSGAQVIYGTDDTVAIQAAISAATTAKGGIVYLPTGNYLITSSGTSIVPANNVSIVGAGIDKAFLYPVGTTAAIHGTFSSGSPLLDCTFSNFTINGINQAGSYNAAIKGIYIQYMKRCFFEHLYILNTGATGLGIDFLLDCTVANVIAESCGRLGIVTSAGAAGIGIGTSSAYGGSSQFVSCITRNNTTYGIFFESQNNGYVKGYSVVDVFSEGNGKSGIGDAGCDGLLVLGGISRNNTDSGFVADGGTLGTTAIGINGVVSNLITYGNTNNGVFYLGLGPYNFRGVRCYSNTQDGFNIKPSGTAGNDTTDLTITDCDIYSNGHAGIWLGNTSSGSGQDRFVITNNRIYNNGTSGNDQHALDLHSSMTDGLIANNRCFDDQGASQTQTFALVVPTGCTLGGNFMVSNNEFRGNKTGMITGSGTFSTTTLFSNNPGVGGSTQSSAYTMKPYDGIVYATGTTTITLPTAVNTVGFYTVKNTGTATVTVATTSSQTIDGATTYILGSQYKYVTVVSNGSNWNIVANN